MSCYLSLLSRVEVQLCMRMLDFKSICALAKCNRRLKSDAESRFALATQDRYSIASHNLAPDKVIQAPGLLQYHPQICVWGPWKTLRRLPDAVIANMMHLDIRNHFVDARGLEEVLSSARRLRKLVLYEPLKSRIAVRLFRALVERERVDGASGLQTLRLGCVCYLCRWCKFA
jgi:hypothetical protein